MKGGKLDDTTVVIARVDDSKFARGRKEFDTNPELKDQIKVYVEEDIL